MSMTLDRGTSSWAAFREPRSTRPPLRRFVRSVPVESVGTSSAALGAITPKLVRRRAKAEQEYLEAFKEGAELAREMAEMDEMDPADPDIWNFAFASLEHMASYLPKPIVTPLQLGGVSCEWSDTDMNIELRIRGVGDVYLVIEDRVLGRLSYEGRDNGLRRTLPALHELARRRV